MDIYAVRWGVLNLFGFTIGGIHIAGSNRERSQGEVPSGQGLQECDRPLGKTEGQLATWKKPLLSRGEELTAHFSALEDSSGFLVPQFNQSVGLIIDLKV